MLSFKETTINLNHSFYIMSNGTRNKVRTDSLKTFLKPSLTRTIVACWEILLSKAFEKGAAESQHSAVSFAAKCRLVRRWCAVRSRLSLKMMEILLSKVQHSVDSAAVCHQKRHWQMQVTNFGKYSMVEIGNPTQKSTR